MFSVGDTVIRTGPNSIYQSLRTGDVRVVQRVTNLPDAVQFIKLHDVGGYWQGQYFELVQQSFMEVSSLGYMSDDNLSDEDKQIIKEALL